MQPILKIDLTGGIISDFDIPEEWEKDFLGGASLAARILFDKLTSELDPLSPEAPLLFLNGPLTGTFGPTVGRFVVCAKSPATGIWGESNCGGFWGPELRKTGYDGIYLTGRAENPVYLLITSNGIEIRDAGDIWGMDPSSVQEHLKDYHQNKKFRFACIGKAGENQIPLAGIMVDQGRAAGRTGLGAVMGSKNLKTIAVFGEGKIPISNEYILIRKEASKLLSEDNMTEVLKELGTSGAAEYFDYLGMMPKKYFSSGEMEGAGNISGAVVAETMLVGTKACHGCVIACGREVRLAGEDETRKGAEYETQVGFGPNLGLSDPEFGTKMGELCDFYGMDTISVSAAIGYAITLYEKGCISENDTNGLVLEWGNRELVADLVKNIGENIGFGRILSLGTRAMEKKFGEAGSAVQVNGLEFGYHDPRAASGMALSYATSPRGACHNQSDYYFVELGQVEDSLGMEFYNRHAGAEKAENVAIHQNWRTLFNSIVMCILANVAPETILDLINSALDYKWTLEDMMICGERGWNLKRLLNNKLGIKRENDQLPELFLSPLIDGGAEGYVIPFEEMLIAYYKARDWDWDTGKPSLDKIKQLGLEWAISGE